MAPRLPPRGFFLNLTWSSPVTCCTRIDGLSVPNVSLERNKIFDNRAELEALDAFFAPLTFSFSHGCKSFLKECESAFERLRRIAPADFFEWRASAVHRCACSSIL
jgi:hypothetical protein